ncbi:hypothetical protein [Brevibacillus laterosporus]|uniref:hypothetical protein n=1 Tax=Brevibacillus laterosporus TaxID=1465 RepID=UPI0003B192B9|nr:hypothetical protein [Brevibacillus laterosporus]ERM17336.1 hypothetical protein P615_21345 [Brevibacillus laterosporus PE36]
MHENSKYDHPIFSKQLNEDFELCKIIFRDRGFVFETDHINYWMIRNGEETIYISSGIHSFLIKRNTNRVKDEIELLVRTDDYSKKYRKGDLSFFVGKGFGDRVLGFKETDMTDEEIRRFFIVSEKFLNLIGENTEELLMSMNPRKLDAVVCADVLYELVGKVLLRLKHNAEAVEDCGLTMEKYEEIHQIDQFERKKLNVLLDGSEAIIQQYI